MIPTPSHAPQKEGGECFAQCAEGYVGSPLSICRAGAWTPPAGGCWADTSTCPGIPTDTPTNADGWPIDGCSGAEGDSCTAACSAGFTGSPTALCKLGAWTNVTGACYSTKNLVAGGCPAGPTSAPGDNALDWNCTNTAEGRRVRPPPAPQLLPPERRRVAEPRLPAAGGSSLPVTSLKMHARPRNAGSRRPWCAHPREPQPACTLCPTPCTAERALPAAKWDTSGSIGPSAPTPPGDR
jgi:hypothetical protein